MVGKLPGGVTDRESLLTGCGGGSIVVGVSGCYLQALSLRLQYYPIIRLSCLRLLLLVR